MYELASWFASLTRPVWDFLLATGPGMIVLTLFGTGGCWAGIRAADRFNERYRKERGVYPIEYVRSRLSRKKDE
jgi:hypothetical protein